ncbi:MAG TPA: DUF222 domain-containing protein [Acidimicrobiales bacterium]|jgi:hypothetical protein|nr:DUF222 domain-containing protein [Acidimicrobiales bacterium]
MAPTTTTISSIATLSTSELMEEAAATSRRLASLAGRIVLLAAELDRREAWREEGATSLEAWLSERCAVSSATARAWAHVGTRLFDLPKLAGGLCDGSVSFDQVRAVVDVARPENEGALVAQASECSVRQLAEVAKAAAPLPTSSSSSVREHETRSVRFNDECRTMTTQLPAEAYAEVRAGLEATARSVPSDGETRWDQRLADALIAMVRAGRRQPRSRPSPQRGTSADNEPTGDEVTPSPYLVVAHVPLRTLTDEESELAGELEHRGLIDAVVARRLACDATLVVALDDDVGHTMYEGRARRDPTPTQRRELWRRDRHCRFPGCRNATFVNPHHLRWWKRDRGKTDLDNLALLCEHHHGLVHSKAWKLEGDANGELSFVGPSGRVMTSRPSPLWTRVSAPRPGVSKR